MGLAAVRRGGTGRKQQAIIRRKSTMAAGQAGKVPGAPPRNPAEARSREARKRGKAWKIKCLKVELCRRRRRRYPTLKHTSAGYWCAKTRRNDNKRPTKYCCSVILPLGNLVPAPWVFTQWFQHWVNVDQRDFNWSYEAVKHCFKQSMGFSVGWKN